MNIYGIDKVRGGTYNKIELTKEEKDFLQRELWMAYDKCLRCGDDDHYIKQCSKKSKYEY